MAHYRTPPRLALVALVLLAGAHGQDPAAEVSIEPPSEEIAAEAPIASIQAQLDTLLASQPGSPEPPTVVLAGHHNDGKSALLEALLGLRLSHVGASTSTRRPLRIHAQHDPESEEPAIFLQRDGVEGAEERVSLAELRAYVESENQRLARDGQIEDAEIRVRLRWRLAPNVVLVDTPGLLSLPPGSAAADKALAQTSAAAERVLLSQLSAHPSRLCLCLEDTADWQLSPTRDVVARADKSLARTLLVATKLDGKLRQFGMPEDLHRLLNPTNLKVHHPKLLGGPIFTCVPPVRDANRERNPAALGEAVAREEANMRKLLVERLGSDEYAGRIGIHALRSELQPLIDARWAELAAGAWQAEEQIIASLEKELRAPPEAEGEDLEDFVHRFCLAVHSLLKGSIALSPSSHGETLQQEQQASGSGPLAQVRRPAAADRRAAFEEAAASSSSSSSSSDASAATSAGSSATAGAAGAASNSGSSSGRGRGRDVASTTHLGSFGGMGGGAENDESTAAALASAAEAAAEGEDPTRDEAMLWMHASKRLYGGAQYHRALQEFMLGASQGVDEEVSVEEIVNAMGVDGYHDGVNYMRAVCVIVVEKARGYFDDALAKLRLRMLHVMSRLCTLADEVMVLEASRASQSAAHSSLAGTTTGGLADADGYRGAPSPAAAAAAAAVRPRSSVPWSSLGSLDDVTPASPAVHAQYMSVVAPVFRKFVTRSMASTMDKCVHDVAAMTRYVSWDFTSPTKDAMHNLLVAPVHTALEARFTAAAAQREEASKRRGRGRRRGRSGSGDTDAEAEEAAQAEEMIGSYEEMVEGFTETLMTRRVTEPMRELINELVREVIRAWREEFCRTISIKLNSGFLLPFCETLPNYMRKEVGRYAREMGLGTGDGGFGGGARGGMEAALGGGGGMGGDGGGGLDAHARTSKLRASIDESEGKRKALQRISSRMHAPRVVKGG